MKKIAIIIMCAVLFGCNQDGESPTVKAYKDPVNAPDGIYIVTFDNGAEEIMWVKDGELEASKLIVEEQLKRIRGHRPIKLVPIRK